MGRKQDKNKIFIAVLILLAALILIVLGVKFIGTSRLETVYMNTSWADFYENIEALCSESDIVAVVEITGVNGQYESGVLMTNYNARLITPINGPGENEKVVIVQTGGIQGNQKFEIRDDPLMEIGDTYLIFGRKNDLGTITILGGPQGRFVYENGKVTTLFDGLPKLRDVDGAVNFLAPALQFKNVDISEIIEKVKNYYESSGRL